MYLTNTTKRKKNIYYCEMCFVSVFTATAQMDIKCAISTTAHTTHIGLPRLRAVYQKLAHSGLDVCSGVTVAVWSNLQ